VAGVDVTVASRTGRSRPASEDRWVAVTGACGLLLAVADGMGGTLAGGPAADAALAGLVEHLAADPATATAGTGVKTADPGRIEPGHVGAGHVGAGHVGTGRVGTGRIEPGRVGSGRADGEERTTPLAIVVPDRGPDLAAAVAAAHERVRRLATAEMPVPLRPGTTLTVALLTGRRLRLAHLGDSSCWLLRRGRLRRLTEEHTHAAQLVAAGAVEPGSVAQRRLDGMLTRFAGMPGSACPQLATVRLRAGDRLLVATDGVTRVLSVPALATLLGRPGITATDLVDAASNAGGRDDATALLAAVPDEVPADMDTTRPDMNTRYVAEGAR
jgi:PPM family protein phosphatase